MADTHRYPRREGHEDIWELIDSFLDEDKRENRTMKADTYEKAMVQYIEVRNGLSCVISPERYQALLKAEAKPSAGALDTALVKKAMKRLMEKGKYSLGFTRKDMMKVAKTVFDCKKRRGYDIAKELIDRGIVKHFGHKGDEGKRGERYILAEYEEGSNFSRDNKAKQHEKMEKLRKEALEKAEFYKKLTTPERMVSRRRNVSSTDDMRGTCTQIVLSQEERYL